MKVTDEKGDREAKRKYTKTQNYAFVMYTHMVHQHHHRIDNKEKNIFLAGEKN